MVSPWISSEIVFWKLFFEASVPRLYLSNCSGSKALNFRGHGSSVERMRHLWRTDPDAFWHSLSFIDPKFRPWSFGLPLSEASCLPLWQALASHKPQFVILQSNLAKYLVTKLWVRQLDKIGVGFSTSPETLSRR